MTKSGAATAATGLQQKALLRGLRSSFSADRQKSRRDALRSSGRPGDTRERCDGIRQELMFEARLFGAMLWAAAGEIKKKRGAWQLPDFSFSVCRRSCRRHRRRRAPQKRCVNGCQNSRPGGVILSPFRALATTTSLLLPCCGARKRNLCAPPGAICKSQALLLFAARRISVSSTARPLTAASRRVLRGMRLRRLMLCGRMSRSAMLLSHVLSRRSSMGRSRR